MMYIGSMLGLFWIDVVDYIINTLIQGLDAYSHGGMTIFIFGIPMLIIWGLPSTLAITPKVSKQTRIKMLISGLSGLVTLTAVSIVINFALTTATMYTLPFTVIGSLFVVTYPVGIVTECFTLVKSKAENNKKGKYCANCGNLLHKDDSYCTRCGKPI